MLHKNYLLVLAQLDRINVPATQHLESSAYYQKLLPSSRKAARIMDMEAGTGFGDLLAVEHQAKTRKTHHAGGPPRDHDDNNEDGATKKGEEDPTKGSNHKREHHPKSFSWGGAKITYSANRKGVACFQVACPKCSSHYNYVRPSSTCRQRRAITAKVSAPPAIALLKTWVAHGDELASRVQHHNGDQTRGSA